MRLLVFGTTGQVAREIARVCPEDWQLTALSRAEADLTDPGACAVAITQADCDAVINAAAYTVVDAAETDAATASAVNAGAPGAIALACAEKNLPLVHISTDYVFDGSGEAPWKPDDPTAPLSAYGATKLGGETLIRKSGAQHAILRTSWVFSAHGNNFVKTMLRLSESRDALNIVADQFGGPTPGRGIAEAVLTLAEALAGGHPGGTYHYAGAPDTSWAGFAREIFRQAGREVAVTDIPTVDYPTPADRPLNSRLDCTSLQQDFGIPRPDWQAGLQDVLNELDVT